MIVQIVVIGIEMTVMTMTVKSVGGDHAPVTANVETVTTRTVIVTEIVTATEIETGTETATEIETETDGDGGTALQREGEFCFVVCAAGSDSHTYYCLEMCLCYILSLVVCGRHYPDFHSFS